MESLILHLSPLGWRLLLFLVVVLYYLFKTFWIHLFKLLLDLFAGMISVAFHILSIFIFLWSGTLRVSYKVIFIVAMMFHTKVLSPVFSCLKHLMRLLSAWILIIFLAIFHQAHIAALKVLKHLRYLLHKPTVAFLTMVLQSYYGLIVYCQENTQQVIWRALKYKILFILLLGCLDELWAVVYKVIQLILAMELPGKDPLEAIITSLPPTIIPLSRSFPGYYPFTITWVSPSYRHLNVRVSVDNGSRSCSFEPPTEPLTTTFSCCCHCHHHARQRRVSGLLPPSRNTLTQQIKTICVTLIIFYYFGDCLS